MNEIAMLIENVACMARSENTQEAKEKYNAKIVKQITQQIETAQQGEGDESQSI